MPVDAFMGRGHKYNLRERFRRMGMNGLAMHEMLELILAYVIPLNDVKAIAKQMIKRQKHTLDAINCDRKILENIPGIDPETSFFLEFISNFVKRFVYREISPAASAELTHLNELCKLLHKRMMNESVDSYLVTYTDANFRFNGADIDQLKRALFAGRSRALKTILSKANLSHCRGVILCRNNFGKSDKMSAGDERFVQILSRLLNSLSVHYLELLLFDGNFIYCAKAQKMLQIVDDEHVSLSANSQYLIDS
jgi:DNA repair protein RadC